jgi:RecA-family ATPase
MTTLPDYPLRENLALVNEGDIADYLRMMFRHVDDWEGRTFGLRGIGEPGTPQDGKFKENLWVLPEYEGVDPAANVTVHVARWSQYHVAAFMLPAVLYPGSHGLKMEDRHVAAFTTLVVDIDSGDIDAKLDYLQRALHPMLPTMIVYSGGVTDNGQPKRHVYWALTEPADDVSRVARLRLELAIKCGGDQAFGRMAQVVRIPGSVHAKYGHAKAVQIAEYHPGREYDLGELAERIEAMQPMPGLPAPERQQHNPLLGPTPVATALTTDIHAGGVDGDNRWTRFNQVAGWNLRMARIGKISVNQAWHDTNAWCVAHMVPPWAEEKIHQEFTALWQRDIQANGPFPDPEAPQAAAGVVSAGPAGRQLVPLNTRDNLLSFAAHKWALTQPGPRRHLVQGLLMAAVPHLFVAEGGAGKSMLGLDLAMQLAASGPDFPTAWLGRPVTPEAHDGAVIFLTAEDSKDEVHIRMRDLDPSGEVIARAGDRLVVVPMMEAGGMFQVAQQGPNGVAEATKAFSDFLSAAALLPKVSLVMIDTLNSSLHGDENSAVVIAQFFNAATRVCSQIGAALMLMHHTRKPHVSRGGDVSSALDKAMNNTRGSGAIKDNVRVQLSIWQEDDYFRIMGKMKLEPRERQLYRFAVTKANNPEMLKEQLYLLRDDRTGLLQDVSAQVADAVKATPEEERDAWIVAVVKLAAEQKHPFSQTGPSGFFRRKVQLPLPLKNISAAKWEGRGKVEGQGIIDVLVDKGLLARADQKGKMAGYLDVPGGPLDRPPTGEYHPDPGSWKAPDWAAEYYFDPFDKVVLKRTASLTGPGVEGAQRTMNFAPGEAVNGL